MGNVKMNEEDDGIDNLIIDSIFIFLVCVAAFAVF